MKRLLVFVLLNFCGFYSFTVAKTCLILPNDFEGNPIWESYLQSAKTLIRDELIFAEVKDAKQYVDSGYTIIMMSVANSVISQTKNQEMSLMLLRYYNENIPSLRSQPTFVRLIPNKEKKKQVDYVLKNQIVLPLQEGADVE